MVSGAQAPSEGDIFIKYHPHSRKDPRIVSPGELKETLDDKEYFPEPPDDEPWSPFSSREDFDFAQLAHDAKLTWSQIDKFIKLIQHCQKNPGSFTLGSHEDLKQKLNTASKLLTNVIASLVV
jgi:hypothetical protein